jgi:hypothetical protein
MKVGEIYKSKASGDAEVLEYTNSQKVKIRFILTGYEKIFPAYSVKMGRIKDPFYPYHFGRGFIGEGPYKSKVNGVADKAYETWHTMFWRCYSEQHRQRRPTYAGCEVHKDWYNYQNFAVWYHKNKIYDDHQLDKDILVKGNKIYSEEFCRFVPLRVNSLLINCKSARKTLPVGVTKDYNKYVAAMQSGEGSQITLGRFTTIEEAFLCYKMSKEGLIRKVADEYKHQITEDVYLKLINWEINIDD